MRRTILLAEPSPTIRKIVASSLADHGLGVRGAPDGHQALEAFASLRPDLVVAEASLAGESGFELCRRIKASARPVPVLLLAEAFEPWDDALAARCGVDDHMVKPFEIAALARRIEALLEAPGRPRATHDELLEHEAEQALDDAERAAEPAGPGTGEGGHHGPPGPSTGLAPEAFEALAREVVARLSGEVIREIARDLIPEVAERVIRERLRELEAEDETP